jgi:hypothetical protein
MTVILNLPFRLSTATRLPGLTPSFKGTPYERVAVLAEEVFNLFADTRVVPCRLVSEDADRRHLCLEAKIPEQLVDCGHYFCTTTQARASFGPRGGLGNLDPGGSCRVPDLLH